MSTSILAAKIIGRQDNAALVQKILTKYGCNIKTRVGFHETGEDKCSMDGFLILQLIGQEEDIKGLYRELNALPGVVAKSIDFKEAGAGTEPAMQGIDV